MLSFQAGEGSLCSRRDRGVRLTAACRLLAQLQPVDGQPVGPPTQVALLSFTFHVAPALGSIGRLDLVAAVAFCPELQTSVHVASGGQEGGMMTLRVSVTAFVTFNG